MNKEEFVLELKKNGIDITDEQLVLLDKYYKLLIEWNEKINLTRITEEKDVYLKHFYDSLTLYRVIDLNGDLSLCDVGTGAGFPGIVLKIVFPTLRVTLVDALLKRVNFLKLVIDELGLKDIEVFHDRAESFARNNREKFDIVTSRAVANLRVLAELSIPMVKVNGYFIPMKGLCDDEIDEASDILKRLGSSILMVDNFTLPVENSQRSLIKIRKSVKTEHKYPRNFDKIKKAKN